jgi:hypothetical protein
MTQTDKEAAPPLVERASRAGERFGHLVGQTMQRVERAGRTLRSEANTIDGEKVRVSHHTSTRSASRPEHSPKERAESLVNQFGAGFGKWTHATNTQTRRTFARLREDVEDVWMDAQDVRSSWRGPSH